MAKLRLVASAARHAGTASVCCRPHPSQCLRVWLCITGRSSGLPSASLSRPLTFNVMQQAKQSLKFRFRLRVRGDHAGQWASLSLGSGGTQTAPAAGSSDLAGSGHAGLSISLVRRLAHGKAAACRLSRAPRGFSFGMLSATFTAVPSNWLCITGRSSRSPSAPAQLQRYAAS